MSGIFLKKINKSFGNTLVLNNVDLEIYEGEFLTLVGPSGCGKSTLLRILAGLESSDSGEVFIGGADMTKVKPADRNLAMVFQSYALYPHLTVSENMLTPLKLRHLSTLERFPLIGPFISREKRNELTERVRKTAKILKLESFLKRKPGQLSGGQRQRAALGRAMVRNPVGFLMDEPLSNLDAALRSEMRVEISKLHKKLSTNMIYVTHDQVEAMTLADKIVILNQGVMEQYGSPDEIYNNPNNIFVAEFIGSPRMNILKIDKGKIKNGNTINIFNSDIQFNGYKFNDDIYLGIRPEHIKADNSQDIKAKIKIDLIENLGFDKIIYSSVNGEEFRIKTSSNIDKNHSQISFSKENVYFFDSNKNRIKN